MFRYIFQYWIQKVSFVQKHNYPTEMAFFFCMWGANRASGIQSLVQLLGLVGFCGCPSAERMTLTLNLVPVGCGLGSLSQLLRSIWLVPAQQQEQHGSSSLPQVGQLRFVHVPPAEGVAGVPLPGCRLCIQVLVRRLQNRLQTLCKVSTDCPLLKWARDSLQ